MEKGGGDFQPDAGGTGSAFGVAGGAILGGLAGSLAGPGGTVAGALAGAAAGGAVGHVVGAGGWADSGEAYWKSNLAGQKFYEKGFNYADYAEALRLGTEGFRNAGGASFAAREGRLGEEWQRSKGSSRLNWEQAREAARAAWERAARGGKDEGG